MFRVMNCTEVTDTKQHNTFIFCSKLICCSIIDTENVLHTYGLHFSSGLSGRYMGWMVEMGKSAMFISSVKNNVH